MGEGIGIPLISLITHIAAYNRLSQQGITSWDESGNHTVEHREIDAWRVIVAVLFFIGFIALITWDAQSGYQGY